jgi:hypothetical protein
VPQKIVKLATNSNGNFQRRPILRRVKKIIRATQNDRLDLFPQFVNVSPWLTHHQIRLCQSTGFSATVP